MKKLFLISFIIVFTLKVFSQNNSGKLDSLLTQLKNLASAGKTEKALNIIDSISNSSAYKDDAKFKVLKSVFYLEVYENKTPGQKDNILLEDIYRNLYKARILDSTASLDNTIKDLMIRVSSHFLYQGVYDFNKKKYNLALKEFLKAEQINKQPFINLEDTMLYFSIGQAALKAGDTSLATHYLSLAYEKGYYSPLLTMQLYDIYKALNKEDSAVYFLKKGYLLFPKNKDILNALANYYLKTENYTDAENVFKQLITIDSSSEILSAYGSICYMKGDTLLAEKLLKKALVSNPQNKDALYNLGLLYYTQAIGKLKKSPYKKTVKKIKPILTKSEKNLTNLIKLEPGNKTALQMLESIYKLLGKKRKQKKIKALLGQKA